MANGDDGRREAEAGAGRGGTEEKAVAATDEATEDGARGVAGRGGAVVKTGEGKGGIGGRLGRGAEEP